MNYDVGDRWISSSGVFILTSATPVVWSEMVAKRPTRFDVDDYVTLEFRPDIVFRVTARAENHSFRVMHPHWGAQLTMVCIGSPKDSVSIHGRGNIVRRFEHEMFSANEMLVLALESV